MYVRRGFSASSSPRTHGSRTSSRFMLCISLFALAASRENCLTNLIVIFKENLHEKLLKMTEESKEWCSEKESTRFIKKLPFNYEDQTINYRVFRKS